MPEPFPENRAAAEVFFLCRYQYKITPAGEALDLDFNAVEIAMRRLGVQDKRDCFLKVVALGRRFRPKK